MNIKEILDCVDYATTELEYVNIMELPDNLRQDFSQDTDYCCTLVRL